MNKLDKFDKNAIANYFQLLADQSQDVFWIRNADYSQQIYINKAYEKTWGRSRQSLLDNPKSWEETIYPEDQEIMQLMLVERESPKEGDVYKITYRIMRPDHSTRWIKDTSFPLFEDENKQCFGYAGIAEDITEEVLREQELKNAKQHAEASNQAKADFLAMMSHELRTPLNAILGMAQILSMKGLPKEFEEYVNIIRQSGSNLLVLVNDILDFTRLELGKLKFSEEAVDLKFLSDQVINNIRYTAKEKGIQLSLKYAEHTPTLVLSDTKRLRQILVNLLNNAIKFTEKGGVSLHIRSSQQLQKTIFHIEVADTGIGINPEKITHIFEKFSQIDSIYQRKQQGVGLGLAITKELVEKMGGTISAESEINQGSIFKVDLPLQLQRFSQEINPELLDNLGNQNALFPLKTLLVEDNIINQKIAKIMLEEVGCTVDIVDTGFLALEFVKKNFYDIIFMDIGLPDISGFEVVAEIRSNNLIPRATPIIAMTAHILERDKQQCFAVGMDGIIEKPISHAELVTMLKHWSFQLEKKGAALQG